MSVRRRTVLASLLFCAFTTPLGIAAHLFSELAGLGWSDDAELAFSARHGYLALLAIVSLAAFAVVLRSIPRTTRRYHVAEIVRSLPFAGRGPKFVALSFVAQFGFFALTQIGEGCPLCSGDVLTGVVAAGFAAIAGAVAVTLTKRRILEFAAALLSAFEALTEHPAAAGFSAYRGPSALDARRSSFAFRYRPPPLAA